ncbi:ribulose-phosphate 3-epimerase [Candidatus Sumerlaeota bacterium]|nr:ribulose-phosphate 3-epimerase [Candidatus Sumerlaeota bacterium]
MAKTLAQLTRKKRDGRREPIIAPSLLAADFSDLKREMRLIRRAGLHWLHLDIMDGHFVPNITFGPPLVASLRKACKTLYFDCHLMVSSPQDFWKPFVQAGAQMITIHEEAHENLPVAIRALKRLGVNVGMSIRPKTRVAALEPVLHMLDLVLVMTVEPGYGGQQLIPNTLNKARQLKLLREKDPKRYKYLIQVDGGINIKTASLAVAAGADVLVAGSSVFRLNNGDIMANAAQLKASIDSQK